MQEERKSKTEKFDELGDEKAAALAQTEQDALEYLLNKYKNTVRLKARSSYLTGADREDIVQEGMIGLYGAIRSFRPDRQASFRSFAEMCITRRILTAIKTATRQKHKPLNNYVSMDKPMYEDSGDRTLSEVVPDEAGGVNPEELFIDRESAKSMEDRIKSKLSAFERSVADMYIEGLSYQEIARKLSKSPKSVDNALQRIKSKVEGILEERRTGDEP